MGSNDVTCTELLTMSDGILLRPVYDTCDEAEISVGAFVIFIKSTLDAVAATSA